MLLAEAHDVVAEREKEMVIAVMVRAVERVGFGDQPRIFLDEFGRNIDGPGIVRKHVQLVRRLDGGIELIDARKFAGLHRRIDENVELHRRKFHRIVRMARHRQRGIEFPSSGNRQARHKGKLVRGPAFRVERDLVPHQDEKVCGAGGAEVDCRSGRREKKIERGIERDGSGRHF